jgi:hypothetical protein
MRSTKTIFSLTLLLLLIFNNPVFSQEVFEIVIDSDIESGITGSCIDSNCNYILTGLQRQSTQPIDILDAVIIKVDQWGDTLMKIIELGDTSCALQKCLYTSESEIISIGTFGIPESNQKFHNGIWIVKFDLDLNIVWERFYNLAGNYWNPSFDISMTGDSVIYIAGYAAIDGMVYDQHIFMMKFNMNGDTLKTNYPYYDLFSKYTYGILNRPDNNGVITFGRNFDNSMTAMQAIEIDSNLNYSIHPIEDPLSTHTENATAKWFTDSTYLLSCRAINDNSGTTNNKDIEILLMNGQHQILEQHWAGRPDTNDYPAWRSSMDFVDKDNIWVSGSIQHSPTAQINTNILVYLLDSNLDIKGMKYYGGDMNYNACTTTATADGGCILGGTVYDWENSFEDDQDLWIKKIFPNDILTNAEDTPDPNDRDIIVYPTLFSNELQIKTFRKQLTFTIYDISGNQVLSTPINNTSTINTSNVKDGFFIYEFSYQNNVIQTGKLLKQ